MSQTSKISQFLKMFLFIGLLVGLVIYIVIINQTSDNTMGWTCIDRTCIQELGGSYDSQKTCLETCTAAKTLKYACNSYSGECKLSDNGEYNTPDCNNQCTPGNDSPGYKCVVSGTGENAVSSCEYVENAGQYEDATCTESDGKSGCDWVNGTNFNSETQKCGYTKNNWNFRREYKPYNSSAKYYDSLESCDNLANYTEKFICNNGTCESKGTVAMKNSYFSSEQKCTKFCHNDASNCSEDVDADGVCCGVGFDDPKNQGANKWLNYNVLGAKDKDGNNIKCNDITTGADCAAVKHCCWLNGDISRCPQSCQVKTDNDHHKKCKETGGDGNIENDTEYKCWLYHDKDSCKAAKIKVKKSGGSDDDACKDGCSCCHWVDAGTDPDYAVGVN